MDLTPYEFSLLQLHKQEMDKNHYIILRNTIYNAGINLLRKKGQREIPLFDKNKNINHDFDEEKIRKEREELFGKNPK